MCYFWEENSINKFTPFLVRGSGRVKSNPPIKHASQIAKFTQKPISSF
jgi:hypothetical protein